MLTPPLNEFFCLPFFDKLPNMIADRGVQFLGPIQLANDFACLLA